MYQPPVPNWLREELLKKKSTPVSTLVQHSTNFDSMESEDAAEPPKRADQSDSRSIGSAKSTQDDEDDEVLFSLHHLLLSINAVHITLLICSKCDSLACKICSNDLF
jgi:hypothetical protein